MLNLSVALFFDFLGSLEEKAYLCRYNFINYKYGNNLSR